MHLLERSFLNAKWFLGLTPEARSRRAVRQLRLGTGDTAIDCGANVGEMTSVMAEGGATVHAFEPNPHACAALRQRFVLNPRVVVHETAVHTADGMALLYLHKNSEQDEVYWSNGSSLLVEKPNISRDRSLSARTINLAAFIHALPSRVRLLKMDIEGAEVDVLRHLLTEGAIDRVDFLFLETHDHKMPWLAEATDELKKELAAHPTCRARFDWV